MVWEAWEAWEKSKKEAIIEQEKTFGKPDGDKLKTTNAERTKKKIKQIGDTKYLDIVKWCIQERNKILGNYAPTKTAITDTKGNDVKTAIWTIGIPNPNDQTDNEKTE